MLYRWAAGLATAAAQQDQHAGESRADARRRWLREKQSKRKQAGRRATAR